MIVCVCKRVSDKDIQRQVQAGCLSFGMLQMETGVATCCGCCDTCAQEVFKDAQAHSARSHRLIAVEVVATA